MFACAFVLQLCACTRETRVLEVFSGPEKERDACLLHAHSSSHMASTEAISLSFLVLMCCTQFRLREHQSLLAAKSVKQEY